MINHRKFLALATTVAVCLLFASNAQSQTIAFGARSPISTSNGKVNAYGTYSYSGTVIGVTVNVYQWDGAHKGVQIGGADAPYVSNGNWGAALNTSFQVSCSPSHAGETVVVWAILKYTNANGVDTTVQTQAIITMGP